MFTKHLLRAVILFLIFVDNDVLNEKMYFDLLSSLVLIFYDHYSLPDKSSFRRPALVPSILQILLAPRGPNLLSPKCYNTKIM